MDLETVKFELREDGIGILTLNRPEVMNPISAQFVADMNEVFDHLVVNLDCRVVIMTGTERAFCAGMDLKEGQVLNKRKVPEEFEKFYYINIPEKIKRTKYFQERMGHIVLKMRKTSQPIIAVVNGPAIGGGFTFAMAADIRLATEHGRFNIGAINVGLGGGDLGGSYFLPRLIGMSRAAELMYTGRFLSAEEAKKIGLIHKIVEEEKMLDDAIELAKELLAKSPLGLRMTKDAINLTLDSPSLETMIRLDNRGQIVCTASKDLMEAFQAYFEKRKPKYPLR